MGSFSLPPWPPSSLEPLLVEVAKAIGALPLVLDYHRHDFIVAAISHLPHLIAYNIVGTAADLEAVTQSEVIKFSAGGFRDFTRIAASHPA